MLSIKVKMYENVLIYSFIVPTKQIFPLCFMSFSDIIGIVNCTGFLVKII